MISNTYDYLSQHHPFALFCIFMASCSLVWLLLDWVKSWRYLGHFRWNVLNRRSH